MRKELKSEYPCVAGSDCIVVSTVCDGCNNHGSNPRPNTSDRINVSRGGDTFGKWCQGVPRSEDRRQIHRETGR